MGRPYALFAIPLHAGERDASDPPTVSVAIGIAEAAISPADQQPKDKPSRASASVGPPPVGEVRFSAAANGRGPAASMPRPRISLPRTVPCLLCRAMPCRLLNLESVSHARPLPEVPPQMLTAHQKRRPPVPSWRDEAPAADGAEGAARTWAAPWRPPRDTAPAGASVSPKRRLVLDQALSALFAKRLGREVGAAAGGRRPAGGGARRASSRRWSGRRRNVRLPRSRCWAFDNRSCGRRGTVRDVVCAPRPTPVQSVYRRLPAALLPSFGCDTA
jgi:hypothetical protein